MSAPNCRDLSEAELARLILEAGGTARDEEAELCSRFARRIRLYGLRHLGTEHAADELVQRVLVLTLEKLRAGRVREPSRIASFILGTARHVSREIRRSGWRERPMADAEALGHAQLEAQAVVEPLERERLARCLEALAERERSIVLLTFYRDHGAGEIATSLSITEGNVRVLRHRAIHRLRRCMGLEEATS
jgi:RNA polymerase sigma-70 factor, ECF subfamily